MHKLLYLSTAIGLAIGGCHTKQAQQEPVSLTPDALALDEAPARTSRPALNVTMYVPPGTSIRSLSDFEARQQLIHRLKEQLAAESPLLVPLNEAQPTLPLADADRVYRRFVATHPNSYILPLFQQRHARSLLIDYGLINTRNWSAIAYYTDQLLAGQSLDFPLMTKALVNLKGHIPVRDYTALLQRTTTAAEAEWHQQQQLIQMLDSQLAGQTSQQQPEELMKRRFLQQSIARLRADGIEPEVKTLHELANPS
ncbi:hypothetical protein ACAW74_00550 [Fibrella sp. WM1]|uniref:hypothetical protein n=1 Tax=Fibrella musci TaxID=3242485 RepID=UPI003520EA9D